MNRLRGVVAAIGLVAVALVGTACGLRSVDYHGDWPSYDSLDVLYDRADLVVQGVLAGSSTVRKLDIGDGTTMVYTVADVTVAVVFKGSANTGQTVAVKQLGGRLDGVDYRAEAESYLSPGQTYLLFLETYEDSPASLLNPWQAQYVVDGSGGFSSSPGNAIRVSRADLTRLAGSA